MLTMGLDCTRVRVCVCVHVLYIQREDSVLWEEHGWRCCDKGLCPLPELIEHFIVERVWASVWAQRQILLRFSGAVGGASGCRLNSELGTHIWKVRMTITPWQGCQEELARLESPTSKGLSFPVWKIVVGLGDLSSTLCTCPCFLAL